MDKYEELKFIDDDFIKELNSIASNKIEYWDIRIEASTGTNVDFTDQKSKEISSYEVGDCGIRTFINGGWGFLVLKDLKKISLLSGFEKAIKLAKLSESLTSTKFKINERDPLIENYNLDNVPIFATGKWKGKNSAKDGDVYTEKDLDEIVTAFSEIGNKIKPLMKLGHDSKQKMLQKDPVMKVS